MSLLDIIVGFYNDIIKLNLYFEWINKNNIMLLNNQISFISGYLVMVIFVVSNVKVNVFVGGGGLVMINGVVILFSVLLLICGSVVV